ncbi:hypothetical protein UCRPC4_g02584 [Phaeomoniella chlamydospora]|uniref:Uncharacterized protein n=1 Tax=Phaeomoniella chlamydospora TaxID=158046 RepID=A0A0G2GKV2_PHACM|nr:hypothetical protein UCRPC4_g02584 [Phaeomoniella chlamydospora]
MEIKLMDLPAVVAGGLALYSGVSLIRHHRRQRRAWIDRELERLRDAQTAFLRGEATAEQLHLLEQERAGEELKIQHEEERRKQKANSLWGKTKRALYSLGGVDVDETELSIGEKLREQAPYKGIMDMVREKELEGKRLLNEGKGLQNAQKPPSVTEPFQQPRTDTNAQGGLLDQLAQNSASAVTNQTKSWFGWASRKS